MEETQQKILCTPKLGVGAPNPHPVGPVKLGGGVMWLPVLSSENGLEATRTPSKVAAAAGQFLHWRTGWEAAMPCTVGWLTTLLRHQSFPLPDLENTGLANGYTDKHHRGFKIRKAVGGCPETSGCPP